jgi:hypothetical protein
MTLDLLPTPMGRQYLNNYNDLKCWYNETNRFSIIYLNGQLEILGKYVAVSIGHAINAALISTISLAHDVAITALLILADFSMFFNNQLIHEKCIDYTFSVVVLIPNNFCIHLLATLCPVAAYATDNCFLDNLRQSPSMMSILRGSYELLFWTAIVIA